MKTKIALLLFASTLLLTIALVPMIAFCQDAPAQQGSGVTSSTPGYAATPTPPFSTTAKPSQTTLPQQSSLFKTPTPTPKPKNTQVGFDFASLTIPAVVIGLCAVGGVSTVVLMKKRRVSESSLRRMSYTEFQNWVVKRVGGTVGSGGGIDGITMSGLPVMIKQSDDIDRTTIEKFAAELARSRKRQGMVVAFGFGGDAIRGKVRAKMSYRLDIEMVTVSELIYSKRMF